MDHETSLALKRMAKETRRIRYICPRPLAGAMRRGKLTRMRKVRPWL